MEPKIYVALDCMPEQVDELIEQLDPNLCGIKIGKELFTYLGPSIVNKCAKRGFSIFLDLKFHDIPNTVAKACAAACKLNVNLLTIHAAGGSSMIQAAKEELLKHSKPPKLLAVTVLTSISDENLKEIGMKDKTAADAASRLAKLALTCGADGLVCSANEAAKIRSEFGVSPILVTPGIRMPDGNINDQKRVTTPKDAIDSGSSYLVIGRPITQAESPKKSLQEIVSSLAI